MWRKWIVEDAFRFPRADSGYYRDKYLALTMILAFLFGFGEADGWPHSREVVIRLGIWALIVVACFAASPRRWLVLGGALAFLSLRGFIAFVSNERLTFLLFGLCVGALALLAGVVGNKKSPRINWPDNYSVLELAIDMAVFVALLFLFIRAQELIEKFAHLLS